ncbi:MAG: IS481 family transposase, partial [Alphaproteobacteria bacterium]
MGQILHGCAKTTEAVRRAIKHSQESLKTLAQKYAINPKTVEIFRWGQKTRIPQRFTLEEEAACVAFRKHT